jgi:hypothetical protein
MIKHTNDMDKIVIKPAEIIITIAKIVLAILDIICQKENIQSQQRGN